MTLWPYSRPPPISLVELGTLYSHQPFVGLFIMLAYHHGLLTDGRVWFELFEGVELSVVLYLLTLPCLVSPIIKRQNDQIRPF